MRDKPIGRSQDSVAYKKWNCSGPGSPSPVGLAVVTVVTGPGSPSHGSTGVNC